MDVLRILEQALRIGASDVHMSAGSPPLARVDGTLVDLAGFGALSAEACKSLIYGLLSDDRRAAFERDLELDCSIVAPGLSRFRVNVLQQRGAVEAVMRVVPDVIPTPEALGLGPTSMGLAEQPRGLVLVTGPTGSGKSTTLACLIDSINRRTRRHIVTIEDPIEFAHRRHLGLVRQREVGLDTHSFAEALRHALRQDPDVILVGEMRDLETIGLALTAAETGHLVLATLHTGDAVQTIDRVIDVFPAHQQQQIRIQLASSLRGVISQILVPRKDARGRVAARELMIVTAGIANLIREAKTHMIRTMIETGGGVGMFTLERALAELVRRGVIEESEAVARAQDPQRVAEGLGKKTAGAA